MARPAYRGADQTAREKLIDAFWESLEKGTFAKLTVSGICAQTGLNRNSFYYHFEDMDDLARTVVEDTLEQDLPALIIAQAGKDAAAGKGAEAGKGAAADAGTGADADVDANAGTGADTGASADADTDPGASTNAGTGADADAGTLAETLDSPLYAREFERVCLIASANSTPALQSMLKAALSKIWCNALGIELDRLAKEDRVIFEFCLGGVFSLLAFRHDAGFGISMGAMLKTDFAREMLASVKSLSMSRASGSSL